jgi:hypothetical protein
VIIGGAPFVLPVVAVVVDVVTGRWDEVVAPSVGQHHHPHGR